MLLKPSVAFLLVFSAAQAYAQLDNPAPDSCVDPAGYSKCTGEASGNFISCSMTQACGGNTTCVNACERAFNGANLACWIQSCWNQLASCFYQEQVVLYLMDPLVTDLSPSPSMNIPFYPPQDGVGGACQCNLGKLNQLWNLANSSAAQDPCPSGSDCACCFQSALLSAYYDLCPTGNIVSVGGGIASLNATNAVLASSDQCQILRSSSDPKARCAAYGSPPFGAKEYLDPISLPPGFFGVSLTEVAGSVTALGVSASMTIMTLPDFTTTITFASYTGVGEATGPSGGNPTLRLATSVAEAVSWTFGPSVPGASAAGTSALGSATFAGIASAATTGISASPSTVSTSRSTAATTNSKSAASRQKGGAFWWIVALGTMLLSKENCVV